MKYTPDTISATDLPIARNHAIGGEKRLWATREPMELVGEMLFAGDGSGVYTADPITSLPAAGADLAVAVGLEGLIADANVVVTVTGTDQTDAALTGTATFSSPSWVRNKTSDFQLGVSVDVATSVAGKKFKTVTGVTATNGKKWGKIKLAKLPDATLWNYVEKVENVTPSIGIQPGVSIPDGLDGTSEVVKGRSEENSLEIGALHRSVVDGLARYAGRQCCLRLEIWKQGKVLTERHLFANCIISVNPTFGDGNETAKQAARGTFEEYYGFYAP